MMDQRYLDFHYNATTHPLEQPLRIELYNTEWFQSAPKSKPVHFKYSPPTAVVDIPNESPHTTPTATLYVPQLQWYYLQEST